MSRLRVAPIVEGHGEWSSVRILLRRVWTELLGGEYVEVLQPIRSPRGKLLQKEELGRRVRLAGLKRRSKSDAIPGLVLLLIDAEEDAACELAPRLLQDAREARSDLDVACVLANPEYETWFAASAESLEGYLDLGPEKRISEDPERDRLKKAWIECRFRGPRYSETLDQPRLAAAMDRALCRSRAPSFDKLCRELASRMP